MITNELQIISPVCMLCRSQFNAEDRQPCTQVCQHSICMKCINQSDGSLGRCPQDGKNINLSKQTNRPLLRYLTEQCVVTSNLNETSKSAAENINDYLEEFADLLKSGVKTQELKPKISPQLGRRLLHLLKSTYIFDESRMEFINRLSSVFKRLLIELIQVHFTTKQREDEFRRLVKKKGCILYPDLTDLVMEILLKLYNGSGPNDDTSFERNILIKFCLKELPSLQYTKKHVEKVIQTLFFSGFFHVIKGDNQPSRYRLKEDLHDTRDLRLKFDIRLIKLAQEEHIRLSPESWTRLLYKRPYPEDVSRLQSLLDKYQASPSYSELEIAINRAGSSSQLSQECLKNLHKLETLINKCQTSITSDVISLELLEDIMRLLHQGRELFMLRQCRSTLPTQTFI